MTIWKDGGGCGRIYREIVNEDKNHVIAKVRVGRSAPYRPTFNPTRPWPEGKENFRLILKAPEMLEALNIIAEGAIVSPDQSPEKIAEAVLRVLQSAREAAAEYMIYAGKQQQRAERTEEALEAIKVKADFMSKTAGGPFAHTDWEMVQETARAAIAAARGKNGEGVKDHNAKA